MMRTSVLMVLPSLEMGGMETMVATLTRGLLQRDVAVHIACLERIGPVGESLIREGVPVALVASPGLRTIFWPAPLRAAIRRCGATVVHCHSGAWLKAARAAAGQDGLATLSTVHGLLPEEDRWLGRCFLRIASRSTDVVVPVSKNLADYLERGVGLPPSRIRWIPNGIDMQRFRPAPRGRLREELGLAADAFVIGSVARLNPIKDFPTLFAAFGLLAEQDPSVHLVVAGDGPERPRLRDILTRTPWGARVHLIGERSDTTGLYPEFDICALASLTEGTSITLLEAMSCAVPVVATAVGGTIDLLARGEAGVLVPPASPPLLAQALRDLRGDPSRRARLGEAGRRRVAESFGSEAMVNRYLALYQELLDPPGRASGGGH